MYLKHQIPFERFFRTFSLWKFWMMNTKTRSELMQQQSGISGKRHAYSI